MRMPKDIWKLFYRGIRKAGNKPIYIKMGEFYDERIAIATAVRNHQEDGMIAVNYSGMDCDCSSHGGHRLVKAIPMAVEHAIVDMYRWVDGPMAIWVGPPSAAHTQKSRDLALEAFENGHPHIVYH